MKDYFELQLVMTNRKIKEAGVNPFIGYLLGLIAFILLSEYIFHKTEFAKYLVILVCLSFQFRLSEKVEWISCCPLLEINQKIELGF